MHCKDNNKNEIYKMRLKKIRFTILMYNKCHHYSLSIIKASFCHSTCDL